MHRQPPSAASFPLVRPASALALAVASLLAGCGGGSRHSDPTAAIPEAAVRVAAACDDFFAYANADWLAATPLPAGDAGVDISTGIALRNQQGLLDALAAAPAPGSARAAALSAPHRALLALHHSNLDRAAVEAAGLAPLAPSFAIIDSLTGIDRLPAVLGLLARRGVPLPLRLVEEPFDERDSPRAPAAADQLRLSLETSSPGQVPAPTASADRLDAFTRHVTRTFALLGDTPEQAAAATASVVAMERRLQQSRDAAAAGRPVTGTSTFDLKSFRLSARIPETLPLAVDGEVAGTMTALQTAFDATAWRSFLRWRLATGLTPQLPARFIAERADWDHGPQPVMIAGGVAVDSRIAFLAATLPEALDRYFVDTLLPAGAAADLDRIGGAIRTSLADRIDSRDWLGRASRIASHHTLDTLRLVSPMLLADAAADAAGQAGGDIAASLRPDALLANVQAAAEHEFDRRTALAGASRTSTDLQGSAWWSNGPFYNWRSHLVFLPPVTVQVLLAVAQDDAGRYGALGSVIAHEAIHAFGAPVDLVFAPGQTLTWLDASDQPHVDGMVARLKSDYAEWAQAHYQRSPPAVRFMGEDLSDVASVPIALDAFLRSHPAGAAQPFFAGFAASQRTRQSTATSQDFIASVPAHALYPYRVNGPLSNLPGFARAYGCRQGDAMVRTAQQVVDLW